MLILVLGVGTICSGLLASVSKEKKLHLLRIKVCSVNKWLGYTGRQKGKKSQVLVWTSRNSENET